VTELLSCGAGPRLSGMPAKRQPKPQYDCLQCPAYCCSYPNVPVSTRDVERLARRFGLPVEVAAQRFTKKGVDGMQVLRHKADHIFPSTCRFLDQETRQCTVYEDRPKMCRDFPATHRCGYFEFLMWERDNQEDDEFVPVVV
jgi:uncharacterized protein